jgi:hypothetical protein
VLFRADRSLDQLLARRVPGAATATQQAADRTPALVALVRQAGAAIRYQVFGRHYQTACRKAGYRASHETENWTAQ